MHKHLLLAGVITLMLWLASHNSLAQDDHQRWIQGWQADAAMNLKRAGAAIVEVNGRIYAIGGVDGQRFLRSVEFTTVQQDGSLAAWQLTSGLNEARGFLGAVAHRGYLYAVAGGNGPHGKHLLQTIERSKINDDGSLSPWQELKTTLVYPRRCVKLAVIGQRLYAFGGYGGTLLDSVESAAITDDGLLSTWQLSDHRLTMPRYVNAVKKVANTVFVLGGHRQTEGIGLQATEYAHINEQQRLSNWRPGPTLNNGRYGLAAAAYTGPAARFLYALGGLDGAIYSDTIERSRLDTAGLATSWQTTTPLASPRANFAAIIYQDQLYIIGGTNRDGYYNTVERATINENGEPGFWGQVAQAVSIKSLAPVLPNSASIIEIIQTEAYSYLKVDTGNGNQWLAAPRGVYKPGDRIRYSRGMTMTHFFSRTLNKTFDAILFVERVEKFSH